MRRIALLAALAVFALPAQAPDARRKIIEYLDAIATTHLEARKQTIAQIHTLAAATRYKAEVRQKVIALIGGLPESRGPVVAKSFGTLEGDGFRVEKLAFQSLPDFWVTANVYVPTNGSGPFPAMVLIPGHEPSAKVGQYGFGVNFARLGFLSLAFDPIGQGERLQYYDPAKKASAVGGPTAEHGQANLPTLLIGDDLQRYMVHDAMRAIDYLTSREDVDAARIGALGCSGGGTATAVLTALDDRVKAAGTACYLTSFEQLLPSPTGVQEAEQSVPHFLEQGLDFADWVEAAAPRPYAIISTTADMFPFEGARQTYEEARKFYAIYGAEDRLQWITGPGGHANLGPISPQILSFFGKHLRGDASPQEWRPVQPASAADLQVTPTGQVSTSLGGETVASLNARQASTIHPHSTDLAGDIRTLAGITPSPAMPLATASATEQRTGYRLETTSLHSTTGVDLGVMLAIPGRPGRKPAVLWMESQSKDKMTAPGGDVDRLATGGRIVLVMEAQPWTPGTESVKSTYLGAFNLLALRAFMVGKSILGVRVQDTLSALQALTARPDVDTKDVTVYGSGALGLVALHAAVLDSRITRVIAENSLASYRSIVETPLHQNVSEVILPGVLRHYDVPDLEMALSPRPVLLINPYDAAGPAKTLQTSRNVTVNHREPGHALVF